MGDELKQTFGAEIELVPGSRGAYTVICDGKEIFSKSREGRFPKNNEIADRIRVQK